MPITVTEIEDADMLRAFTITSLAFQRNEPFWDVVYPQHWTEVRREAAAKRWTARKRTDPKARFVKAVDEESGEIMGMAKWLIYHPSVGDVPESQIEGEGPGDGDPEQRALCDALVANFLIPRNEAILRTKGHLVDLDALAVDPVWQRKGAGDALVKWGCLKADELGVEAVVESTICAKKVYGDNGFRTKMNVVVVPDGSLNLSPSLTCEKRFANSVRVLVQGRRNGTTFQSRSFTGWSGRRNQCDCIWKRWKEVFVQSV